MNDQPQVIFGVRPDSFEPGIALPLGPGALIFIGDRIVVRQKIQIEVQERRYHTLGPCDVEIPCANECSLFYRGDLLAVWTASCDCCRFVVTQIDLSTRQLVSIAAVATTDGPPHL